MIDFHSHFLPHMDDGSKSMDESLRMLNLSYNMGIDAIVSTSHYFSDSESIDKFLSRRKERLDSLASALEGIGNVPRIIEGAEVAFYPGMGSDNELMRLCIGDTKCVMIEMPYCRWSSLSKRELLNMMLNRGITPILAHIDRYQQCADSIEELLCYGAIAQINGESLIDSKQRKRMLKLIKERKKVLLGSDCHNMENRRPNLDRAFSIIEKSIGRAYLDGIEQFSRELLKQGPI